MKIRLSLLLLLIILGVQNNLLGGSAQTALKDPGQIEKFKTISDKLVCQCSCQMILYVCNHENCPSAIPMRLQIEKRIQEGWRVEQIMREFTQTYGAKVLSAPSTRGFNLMAWIMPGIIAFAGLVWILFFLRIIKEKHRKKETPRPLSSDVDKKIEEELKDWKD